MSSGALAVRDLTVDLLSVRNSTVPVVSGVSFQVDPGTIVGLFGESGCGKTTLALALLNLLPASRYRVRGFVQLRDFEVLSATEHQLERIRGAEISSLFRELREKLQTSFLLISHSPGVLARTADQVLIMHAGRIMERGTPRQVFGKGIAHGR